MLAPARRLTGRALLTGLFAFSFLPLAQAETFLIPDGDVAALQAALDESATNGEVDFIDLNGATFTLTEPVAGTHSGLIVRSELVNQATQGHALSIENGTIERSTAAGTPDFRLFEVHGPEGEPLPDELSNAIWFAGLVLRNGHFNAGNVSTSSTGGGAIHADWPIAVVESEVLNNSVSGNGSGGAIYTNAIMGVLESTLSGNTSLSTFANTAGRGGAIYANATVALINSALVANQADAGGAIYENNFGDGVIEVRQSQLSGNSATNLGGALWSRGKQVLIENSTFFDNSASGGGAIYSQRPASAGSDGELRVSFSTIVNNRSTGGSGGAGIRSQADAENGLVIVSSIIGGNRDADGELDNCSVIDNGVSLSPIVSSLSDDESCNSAFDLFTNFTDIADVLETSLANAGGSTQVLKLVPFSPAIDASTADDCPATDQRGVSRDDACDIGAHEADDLPVAPVDSDGDGIPDEAVDDQPADNCPAIRNADQIDADGDGLGDVCDDDRDGDGIPQIGGDTLDNCPDHANPEQQDTDQDGRGDSCDPTPEGEDSDGDGIGDAVDNCPMVNSTDLTDTDGDGEGNVCDTDDDGDGVLDVDDDYPLDPDRSIADGDEDGVRDSEDNCPAVANENQTDTDGDGTGDACDATPGGDGEDGSINESVEQVAEELDVILAESSGQIRRILWRASRYLDYALRSSYWASDDELSERRGHVVFTYTSLAVNEIERVADSRSVDASLRAELDVLTASLLADMRELAENRIADARSANGVQWRISRAEIALSAGDREQTRDWLRGAVDKYGLAWRWARSAD